MSTKSTQNRPSKLNPADGSEGPSVPTPQPTKRSDPASSTSGDGMSTVEGGQTSNAMWRVKAAQLHRERVEALVQKAPITVLSSSLQEPIREHFKAMMDELSSLRRHPTLEDVWNTFHKITKDTWVYSNSTGSLRPLLTGHAYRWRQINYDTAKNYTEESFKDEVQLTRKATAKMLMATRHAFRLAPSKWADVQDDLAHTNVDGWLESGKSLEEMTAILLKSLVMLNTDVAQQLGNPTCSLWEDVEETERSVPPVNEVTHVSGPSPFAGKKVSCPTIQLFHGIRLSPITKSIM